jgi:hypothetical protein
MKRRMLLVILPLLAALGLGSLTALTPLANAGQITPQPGSASGGAPPVPPPSQPQVQNTAEWTLSAINFQSQYPHGMTFSIRASSTGGPIVAASVEWVHRAHRAGQTRRIRREQAEIDPETGVITAVWEPMQSDAVPPWVEVRYNWKLRDEAGNQLVSETLIAEYEDYARPWIRTEADDVIVFSTGLSEEFNQTVIEAMESIKPKYVAGWGDPLPYRPRVILFADREDFDEWRIFTFDTSTFGYVVGGFSTSVWGGTVQVVTSAPDFLAYSIVPHEIEHLYQQEYLAKRVSFTPDWFTEGDAVFYETHPRRFEQVDQYVARRVADNSVPPLLDGLGPRTGGADALEGYYLGYTFMKWIDDTWGIAKHREIMDLLADDLPFVTALEQALGMNKVEIERAWRRSIGASGDAPTLIPTWTPPPMLPSPTPFTFGNN